MHDGVPPERARTLHRVAAWTGAALLACVLGNTVLLGCAVRHGFVRLNRLDAVFDPSTNAQIRPVATVVVAADVCLTVVWLFAMAGRSYEKERIHRRSLMGFCPKCGYDLASTGRLGVPRMRRRRIPTKSIRPIPDPETFSGRPRLTPVRPACGRTTARRSYEKRETAPRPRREGSQGGSLRVVFSLDIAHDVRQQVFQFRGSADQSLGHRRSVFLPPLR